MTTLFYNAHLLDEELDHLGAILVCDHVIKDVIPYSKSAPGELSKRFMKDSCPAEVIKEVDLMGATVTPSFVDLHTHLRDPGLTQKETIETGLRAAMTGGFSTIVAMANTKPVISSKELAYENMVKAQRLALGVRLFQAVSITRDFGGYDISHLDNLNSHDIPIISEDGQDVQDESTMRSAMLVAKKKGIIVACHCQSKNPDMRAAEDEATARNLALALDTGARVHICHVSTKKSIGLVREAKRRGANVTCEVTPHHLLLTEDSLKRVNPPLRGQEDIDALLEGVADGTVDAIASDHAPHTLEDKRQGAPGFSGIETSFSACNTVFEKSGLNKTLLIKLMAGNPSKILGLDGSSDKTFGLKFGRLKSGYQAEWTIIDIDKEWVVHGNDFVSKGKVSAFEGMTLKGKVSRICHG